MKKTETRESLKATASIIADIIQSDQIPSKNIDLLLKMVSEELLKRLVPSELGTTKQLAKVLGLKFTYSLREKISEKFKIQDLSRLIQTDHSRTLSFRDISCGREIFFGKYFSCYYSNLYSNIYFIVEIKNQNNKIELEILRNKTDQIIVFVNQADVIKYITGNNCV